MYTQSELIRGDFVLMKKNRYTDKCLLFTSDHPTLNWVSGVNFKRTGIKMVNKAKKCPSKVLYFQRLQILCKYKVAIMKIALYIKGKALSVFSKQVLQIFIQYALFLRENWLLNSLSCIKNLSPHCSVMWMLNRGVFEQLSSLQSGVWFNPQVNIFYTDKTMQD